MPPDEVGLVPMVKIAGRDVATGDVGVLAGGGLVFIASFLPWMRVNWYYYRGASHAGWACGFFAVVAILFSMGVAGFVAARIFGGVRLPPIGPVGPALLNVILGGVATLFILIRLITVSPYDPGAGLYLGLVGAAVLTGFAIMALPASGGSFPGRGSGPLGPQPPFGGQQPPFAPGPYGQPYGYQPQPGTPYAQQSGGAPYGQQGAPPGYPQPGPVYPQPGSGYGQRNPAPGYGTQGLPTGYGQPPAAFHPPYGQSPPPGQAPAAPASPAYGQPPAPGTPAPDHEPPAERPPAGGQPYGQQPG